MKGYFSKHRRSVLEIVCIAVIIACVPVAVFLPGGIPLGMPIMGVMAFILIIYNGAKTKDAEVDALLASLLDSHQIPTDPSRTLRVYDLGVCPIVKGKDNRLRTPLYVVSVFDHTEEGLRITVDRVNLLDGTVERNRLTLPADAVLTLTETAVSTPVGKRTRYALTYAPEGVEIPVSVDDIDSSGLVESLTR